MPFLLRATAPATAPNPNDGFFVRNGSEYGPMYFEMMSGNQSYWGDSHEYAMRFDEPDMDLLNRVVADFRYDVDTRYRYVNFDWEQIDA